MTDNMGIPDDMDVPSHRSTDALIRQILDSLNKLHGEVATMQESRSSIAKNENRIIALEGRLSSIEILMAKGEGAVTTLSDHEKRIRSLENVRWQMFAVVGAATVIWNLLSQVFGDIIRGG